MRNLSFTLTKVQANRYNGYDGLPAEELLMYFTYEQDPPQPGTTSPAVFSRDRCLLKTEAGKGLIKVPLFTGTLRHFFTDYQNYYYFPDQDTAIHRSAAVYADKTHRVPAKASTCYTRKEGTFLPHWGDFRVPSYKAQYSDKMEYFEFTKAMQCDDDFFSEYADYLIYRLNIPES